MISHRLPTLLLLSALAAPFLTGCSDRLTDPTAPAVQAGPASLTTTPTSLPKIAQIDARFLIAKSGAALIEVRTGTFDDATNTGTPNGYFDKITYTVKNPQG